MKLYLITLNFILSGKNQVLVMAIFQNPVYDRGQFSNSKSKVTENVLAFTANLDKRENFVRK